ncbi:MAG: hypothetical protein AAGA75_23020, partial [Cyanobacteria bacterium P01_E01_bin.6]
CDAIAQADPSETSDFAALYRDDEIVRELCHEILKASGIDPCWVDSNHIVQFIHHYEEDGETKPSIIHQLNRLDKPSTGEGGSMDQYVAYLCSVLVTLDLCSDIKAAREMLMTMPMDYIEGIVAEKIESRKTPEQREKEKIKAEAEAAILEQTERMKKEGIGAVLSGFTSSVTQKGS